MRAVVHLATALAFAALAFAVGRWLRDPSPGGPLVLLICAAVVFGAAIRRLYAPGGLGRRRDVGAAEVEPEGVELADDRIDLNDADVFVLQTLPGIGAVGARRIVEEREAGGPFTTVGDLVRVAGFGPGRVHSLGPRVKV
jgi:DNA uptake protein ComE-like DNA-binding protein